MKISSVTFIATEFQSAHERVERRRRRSTTTALSSCNHLITPNALFIVSFSRTKKKSEEFLKDGQIFFFFSSFRHVEKQWAKLSSRLRRRRLSLSFNPLLGRESSKNLSFSIWWNSEFAVCIYSSRLREWNVCKRACAWDKIRTPLSLFGTKRREIIAALCCVSLKWHASIYIYNA